MVTAGMVINMGLSATAVVSETEDFDAMNVCVLVTLLFGTRLRLWLLDVLSGHRIKYAHSVYQWRRCFELELACFHEYGGHGGHR